MWVLLRASRPPDTKKRTVALIELSAEVCEVYITVLIYNMRIRAETTEGTQKQHRLKECFLKVRFHF